MEYVNFKDTLSGRFYKARVFDAVPEVEDIDYNGGINQIIACEPVLGARPTREYDEGTYDFYEVVEFLGSQCNEPEDFEDNSERYFIAVWSEYEGADDDSDDEE